MRYPDRGNDRPPASWLRHAGMGSLGSDPKPLPCRYTRMTIAAPPIPLPRRLRLWAEFCSIFGVLPLVMALHLPPAVMWSALAGMFLIAVVLLSVSDGFDWRDLLSRPDGPVLIVSAVFTVLAGAVSVGLVLWLRPHALFGLPRYNFDLWLTIVLAYPFLSALPQEIVFRALFFGRYGILFPSRATAILVNAGTFALAHLFYWNWPAVVLTGMGGIVFAWAYLCRRSFLLAWALHVIAGLAVFTSGLGVYFYHGAVFR